MTTIDPPAGDRAVFAGVVLLCSLAWLVPAWVGWLLVAVLAVGLAIAVYRDGRDPGWWRERQVRFRAVTWRRRVPITAE